MLLSYTDPKKHPKNIEVFPGIFYKTSYGCMCQSFFLVVLLFFPGCSKTTINIRFFENFDMLIFRFLVKISRSIIWPPQGQ